MASQPGMWYCVVLYVVVSQLHSGCAKEASNAPIGVARRLLSISQGKAVNGTSAECVGANGTCAMTTAQPEVEVVQHMWTEVSRSHTDLFRLTS